jgi:ABC-type sugar transport system permease subunit
MASVSDEAAAKSEPPNHLSADPSPRSVEGRTTGYVRQTRRSWRRGWIGLLWLTPAAVVVLLVKILPLVGVARDSLSDRTLLGGGSFVGAENFRTLAEDPDFHVALTNTAVLLASVPLSIGLALVAAALLFRGVHGSAILEAAYFLPFIPAIAATSVVFIFFLGDGGPVNTVWHVLGGDASPVAWLTSTSWARWSVMGIMTWKRIGLLVLLFLARLASVDRELFEAAAIDGATWSRAFRAVAIPELGKVLAFGAVLGCIEVFSYAFGYVFVLTQGGPENSTYTLDLLLYRFMFDQQNVALAAAVAMSLIGVVVLTAALLFLSARKRRSEGAQ